MASDNADIEYVTLQHCWCKGRYILRNGHERLEVGTDFERKTEQVGDK